MPAADRIDHLARLSQGHREEPPEGAPLVTQDLIEWLTKNGFGQMSMDGPLAGSLDGALSISHEAAFRTGQLSVLQHLKTLMKVA